MNDPRLQQAAEVNQNRLTKARKMGFKTREARRDAPSYVWPGLFHDRRQEGKRSAPS